LDRHDDHRLLVHPVVLGAGERLFTAYRPLANSTAE
jgi:hypothetical protein